MDPQSGNKINQKVQDFTAGPDKEAEMMANAKMTQELSRKYRDLFTVIICVSDKFSCWAKEGMKPYQAPPRCMAYVLQKSLEKELVRLK